MAGGWRDIEDTAGAALRCIRAVGRRNAQEGDEGELPVLWELRAAVDDAMTEAVLGLRAHGVSDSAIAEALGLSRQAISKRWPGAGVYKGPRGHRERRWEEMQGR